MRTFLLVGIGTVIGVISILSLPFAFGDNENDILARLKKLEEKIRYREKAFPIMLRSVSNGPKNRGQRGCCIKRLYKKNMVKNICFEK